MTLHGRRDPHSKPIPNPGRYLLLAIIHQAAIDATDANQKLTHLQLKSAKDFLQSRLYFQLCHQLGIQPSHARALSEKAVNGRLTPIRKRQQHG